MFLIEVDSYRGMEQSIQAMGNVYLFHQGRILYWQYKYCKWFQVLSVYAKVLCKQLIPPWHNMRGSCYSWTEQTKNMRHPEPEDHIQLWIEFQRWQRCSLSEIYIWVLCLYWWKKHEQVLTHYKRPLTIQYWVFRKKIKRKMLYQTFHLWLWHWGLLLWYSKIWTVVSSKISEHSRSLLILYEVNREIKIKF